MEWPYSRRTWLVGGLLGYMLVVLALSAAGQGFAAPASQGAPAALNVPGNSSPIAIGGGVVWVVNPDDDSVTLINEASDTPITRIFVGDEPQSIALDLNNNAYVANAADNSVTVINFVAANPAASAAVKTLVTGAEPFNIVATPNGQFVYVSNSAQDTISVITTSAQAQNAAVTSTFNIGTSACNVDDQARQFQPRGLAVTANNSFLFVTRFLSFTKPGGQQGTDTGKEGLACRLAINGANGALSQPTPIRLAAQDTGFAAKVGNPAVDTPTSAYPNQLQSVVICGSGANERAYLPNIAASPAGPLSFNVDTHAFVNSISTLQGAPVDAGALNLHLGARDPEPNKTKLFFANPWAIACNNPNNPTFAYAVSAGSDLLVKLTVNSGALGFTGDGNTTRYIDLNDAKNNATSGSNAGKNPLGIAINSLGTKAYVMNFVSRNVSIVDLATDAVVKVVSTSALPPAGSPAEEILAGAEVFFSSRGVFQTQGSVFVDRLSSEGWQNCASCHFNGLTDGNIWIFGAGPRKSVPLNGTFSPHNPDDQRILNYSAIFDEVEDFELNIRNVSGPGNDPATNTFRVTHGLLIGDNGDLNTPPAAIPSLANLANAGRPQHTIRLPGSSTDWPALTALRQWVRFAVRTPNGALTTDEISAANGGLDATTVRQGRTLFFRAGCHTCHGGTKWTISSKDFTSPPVGAEVATETNPAPPAGVTPIGTPFLARFLQDISSFKLGVPGQGNLIGNNVGAFERANAAGVAGGPNDAGPLALGIDHNGDGKGNGYNTPSLLGIAQLQPFYHNGACETLACVLSNQKHRTANGARPDTLGSATDQARVVAWLRTLDAETAFPTNLSLARHDVFFDPPVVLQGTQVEVGANISLFGTRADLSDLLAGGALKVKFSGPGLNTEVDVPAFAADFGQVTVKVPWSVPATLAGPTPIIVTVDAGNTVAEANEQDNSVRRVVVVRPPPPDRTPPTVSNVLINDGAAVATSREAKVKFNAEDPAGSGGAQVSGLDAFCLVRYTFNSARRRWVEEPCSFTALPTPAANGSFEVNLQLTPREGTAYAFVWVRDKAGNISRQPGFDVISFLPAPADINLHRNEVRVFRIALNPGQSFTFNAAIAAGDVDLAVFQGVTADAPRIALSANNGTLAETVSFSVPAGGNPTTFQVEVRAVVNSRIRISFTQAAATTAAATAAPAQDQSAAPFIVGPPALQAAIDEQLELYAPMVQR